MKGTEYGAGVSDDIAFDVYNTDRLTKQLSTESDSLKNIVIRAKVTRLCPKKGCWLTLENLKRFQAQVMRKWQKDQLHFSFFVSYIKNI